MAYAPIAAPPAGWARPGGVLAVWRRFPSRVASFCIVELQKLRRDSWELVFRAVQPVLWLIVYGVVFSRVHAIHTGKTPYLTFLVPGIVAQACLFMAVFFGIQIIWERDAGILTKLLATPTPRAALVWGKGFAAGLRGLSQIVVVVAVGFALGARLTLNPLKLLLAAVVVMIASGFFASLSMALAGIFRRRERLMGVGQLLTMPLFFASSALYPIAIMPAWLATIARLNPLTYQVDALRNLLVGSPSNLLLDLGALLGMFMIGTAIASSLIGRLVR